MTTRDYQRIAVEEAWAPEELLLRYRRELESTSRSDPGFRSLWGFYGGDSDRATQLAKRLQDLGERRLRDMDAAGIDRQLVFLTPPGVQIFSAPLATSLAASCNDQLADGVRGAGGRLAGLAAVAPQDPAAAALELERAVTRLGLKGVVINSHIQGEYLDDEKYWEIFAAAQALDVPLYLHPNTPSPGLIEPLLSRGLEVGMYGFAVETGLHALRIIVSGALDRFPRLRIVLGHLGEGLPFWFDRLDYLHAINVRANRYPGVPPLQRKPSDYLRENFYYTTSGMPWEPVISFVRSVVGTERVMYAMDYPYQYVPQEVAEMERMPLNAGEKRAFFQTNAERVFALLAY
ncbi:amidohydrolase [Pigmentiphaga sp. H8]|uniref:amidohydrolase family protein n=1 Tax=Pigmentiphaga sp. H8 TaxID=2488560 RepID=UPI000F59D02F|nr:amidohydrolase family protein [Pigmentiphaga sp. H8]AZG06622.1 amidohydrolase [Pigmentiphaga sp. H8]